MCFKLSFRRSSNTRHEDTSLPTSYVNFGQNASGQATINNIKLVSSDPLEKLQKHCAPSAAFNSVARSFNLPRCAKCTRLRIIQTIKDWINTDGDSTIPSSIFWLYGGAGVGKSAIAQSLSDELEKTQLAASFFFAKSDPSRNNGEHLFPTIISQLANTFKEIRPFIRAKIREHSALLTERAEIQFQELVIEPLHRLRLSNPGTADTKPRLIVIDGLNECHWIPDVQPECELLRVIARLILQIPYPLRFLITSRPEAHIIDVFNNDPDLQAIAGQIHRYNLSKDPDADMDIRKFLEGEFADIRRVHRIKRCLPYPWPDRKAIPSLVKRSSRHFIYASTVIRWIRSPNHRPDDRLQVILRVRPPQKGDRPYAQLDALYALIFQDVKDRSQLEKICLILGILYFQSRKFESIPGCNVDRLLGMRAGDLELLLGPISSLISIDGDKIHVLHKSLFDYLLDSDRSGHLPFDLMRARELAATHILNQRIVNPVADLDDFRRFAWHCRFSYPNKTLKGYLQSLEVPFPESIMTSPTNPNSPARDMTSISIIWHIFRTLSRKDLYFTRHYYEQYLAKWINYLHLAVPTRTECQSGAAVAVQAQVEDLKRELDDLLAEWKPANLNQIDIGTDPIEKIQREDDIKQEHSVFSFYAQAGNTNSFACITSLVYGATFVHSYNLWVGKDSSFLYLRTYSRHRDESFSYGYGGYSNLVQRATVYLEKAEKCLVSNLYQKYGVMPEVAVNTKDKIIKESTTTDDRIQAQICGESGETETDTRSLKHQSSFV